MAFFSGQFRMDAVSHIITNKIAFEAFLFVYLVTALWMQHLNIYKKNFHLIDYSALFFVTLLLSRRLIWSVFQNMQTKVEFLNRKNSKYWFVAICFTLLFPWMVQLFSHKTSLFNVMFLFYPLLLYLSLFGFTLEPRQYRERFSQPKGFMGHTRDHPITTTDTGEEKNSFFLPIDAEEIRSEVSIMLSDVIMRMKQLLFNSLICAYYVGFIPIQFTPNYVYFDKWWSFEMTLFVWANSFVILSCHYLPPNYCQILHHCALHLGCWGKCSPETVKNSQKWASDKKWSFDSVVELNNEYFKAEGPQNVAIPCDSSHEFFYLLFSPRFQIHSWLLVMQLILVAFEIVVLFRITYWYQILSISSFLIFNYFILHKLLYNRLLLGKLAHLIESHNKKTP